MHSPGIGMSFYDELGVDPSASQEEIQRAYRELVRLMHPDRCGDDGVRRAAERQMKRLNAILTILNDPAERRRYDLSLAGNRYATAGECAWAHVWLGSRQSLTWVAVSIVAAAGLMYYCICQAPTGSIPLSSVAQSAVAAVPRLKQTETEFAGRRAHRTRNTTPMGAGTRSRASGAAQAVAMVSPDSTPKEETDREREPVIPPVGSLPYLARAMFAASLVWPPAADRFGGTWLYAKPANGGGRKLLYPPEYIEVTIVENANSLAGRYRARYRVTDQMLWPEVRFEFEGLPGQNAYKFRESDGGHGELYLKLLQTDRLELSWWATKLERPSGLGSGTAVLVRDKACTEEEP